MLGHASFAVTLERLAAKLIQTMRKDIVVAIATLAMLGCAIVGGIFFAFSNFVMQALAMQSPANATSTMQAINIRIVNPLFLSVFLGTPLLYAIMAVTSARHLSRPGSKLMIAAAATYLIGALAVTAVFNIPLNDHLAGLEPTSDEATRFWSEYLSSWIVWNHVRTVSALASIVLLSMGIARLPPSGQFR